MNIIVCCDGTWNTPDAMEDGVPSPTNVVKIHHALALTDAGGNEQKFYYHPGVGTDGTWVKRILGGSTGKGLDDNIISAYHWLARTYRTGDRIWLFGFSRGAYTVRSLGGMISKCGLLDLPGSGLKEDETWSTVRKIFDAYRKDKPSPIKADKKLAFHGTAVGHHPGKNTPIHFIGVWDTVGALGIPDDMALLNLLDNPDKHRFHDTALGPAVRNARHAVALDEFRQSFLPTLWEKPEGWNGTLKQVWFPGAHGDVGGGYGRTGLSDGALYWMMQEAEALGLAFNPGAISQLNPDPRGMLHNSVDGVFKALKTRPRAAPLVSSTPSPQVHASAQDRHRNPPLSQGRYRPLKQAFPVTIDVFARERWNDTGVYLRAGKSYRFEAKGEWTDSSIKCGPGGARDGKFQAAEIAHVASSAWGGVETLWKKLTGNKQIDFWWTRREEEIHWFCLVGLIANNVPPPQTNEDQKIARLPHEVFEIGEGVSMTPKGSGYLYCFANDAWQAYDNNRGSVQLTIYEG
ncbi:MAG: DUF2235 domain-containing protein [Pseudorhizobium sp.]